MHWHMQSLFGLTADGALALQGTGRIDQDTRRTREEGSTERVWRFRMVYMGLLIYSFDTRKPKALMRQAHVKA